MESIINNWSCRPRETELRISSNTTTATKSYKQHNQLSNLHSIANLFATLKMRATTTILFIAGFIGAAFAADTKQFSDENWYVASVPSTTIATLRYNKVD